MKTSATFTIDIEVLSKFDSVAKQKSTTPDELIEEIIKNYLKNSSEEPPQPTPPSTPPSPEFVEFTEKLLLKCKKLRVGQLANILLRGLLERGVASEYEIEEMQKVPSDNLASEFNLPFGRYSNREFGLNFPLLIEENGPGFIIAKAWKNTVRINGKNYYLCAQWFQNPNNNDRERLENWIMEHLPKWLENSTNEQKSEFINFVKTKI